ncbi:MAG: hypothetical protein QFX38_07265 [Methanothermobacter sp.]|nr:hypothetical protein [Methanothermobacter sp.]
MPFWQLVFTWLMTVAGAPTVFIAFKAKRKFPDASLGFAAGVMIAASFWFLLTSSIELFSSYGPLSWLSATLRFFGKVVYPCSW